MIPEGYTGFLALECELCGRTRCFYAKKPVWSFECACGQRNQLTRMKPVYAMCNCGRKTFYQTNSISKHLSITCKRCGSPVNTEYRHSYKPQPPFWGRRGPAFVTIM